MHPWRVLHVSRGRGPTLPKDKDLKELVKEYGGDDYQDVY